MLVTHVDNLDVLGLDLCQGVFGQFDQFFGANGTVFLLGHIKLIQLNSVRCFTAPSVRRTVQVVRIDVGQYCVRHQKPHRLAAGQQLSDLRG
ncbi:hypothetical protein D3C75_1094280 [compost metagenome]